jgi:hypothetical protein
MFLVSLTALTLLQGPLDAPPRSHVDARNFAAVVAAIVPRSDELTWRAIPWRPTLRDGVVDATAAEKPVLLWAMNGHPLGTT